MGPETLADLDTRLVPVYVPPPDPNPLLPKLARACLAAVALACVAAAALLLGASQGNTAPVAVLYAALAVVAAALMRLPEPWLGHGLTGHLMLMALSSDLRAGDHLTITLIDATGCRIAGDFVVRAR